MKSFKEIFLESKLYFNVGERVEGIATDGTKFNGVITNRRFHTANSNISSMKLKQINH